MKYEKKTIKQNGMEIKPNKGMELGREILIPLKTNQSPTILKNGRMPLAEQDNSPQEKNVGSATRDSAEFKDKTQTAPNISKKDVLVANGASGVLCKCEHRKDEHQPMINQKQGFGYYGKCKNCKCEKFEPAEETSKVLDEMEDKRLAEKSGVDVEEILKEVEWKKNEPDEDEKFRIWLLTKENLGIFRNEINKKIEKAIRMTAEFYENKISCMKNSALWNSSLEKIWNNQEDDVWEKM